MVIRTLGATEEEAARFHSGEQSFLIRGEKEVWNKGDCFNLQVCEGGRRLMHHGEDKTYVVTATYDSRNMPILPGFQIIASRRLQK